MLKLVRISFLAAIFGIAMMSCKDDKVKFSGLDLKELDNVTVKVGETVTKSAKVTPANYNASPDEFSITSTPASIATATGSIKGSTITVSVTGVSPGDATVAIKHTSGLQETRVVKVVPQDGNLTVTVSGTYTYNGAAQTPSGANVVVKLGETTLTAGTHYSLGYTNNTNAGTATVTATGAGVYAGKTGSGTFTISPLATALTVTVAEGNYTYNATAQTPSVTVKAGETTLTVTTDYTLAYTDNTVAGTETAKVAATGVGNYAGSTGNGTFTIAPCPISVKADNAGKAVGAPDPLPFTYTFEPALFGNDKFTGALTREEGETLGATYAITQGTLTAGSNYVITFTPGIFNISLFAGKGTNDDPYQIGVATQLAALAELVNENNTAYNDKYYKLTADINLSTYQSGAGWVPIGTLNRPFQGHFDGNKHVVKGLYINNSSLSLAGLFGEIYGGTLKNLGVEGEVTGQNHVGGLAGRITNGSITNCYSTVTVTGYDAVGSLLGNQNDYGVNSITNCYATGDVNATGPNGVGGLVGWLHADGSVTNCYVTGKVSQSGPGMAHTGGITGSFWTNRCIASNCIVLNPSVTGSASGRILAPSAQASGTLSNNLVWEDMLLNGNKVTTGTHDNAHGENISSDDAKDAETYKGLGWKFGNDDDNPWKMGVGAYPLPVFYWQTSAPKADVTHLN